MGIKEKYTREDKTVSKRNAEAIKRCKAAEETVLFSFTYFTDNKEFNFSKINKPELIGRFFERLKRISQMTWDKFSALDHRKGGYEPVPVKQLKPKFFASLKHVTPDEKIFVTRFGGRDYRLFFKRGSKCGRVAHVLACEFDLGTAYDH